MLTRTQIDEYSEEPWYKEQTKRWDALEAQGWKFDCSPRRYLDTIGMVMRRGNMEYAIGLKKGNLQFKELHIRMLALCETAARLEDDARSSETVGQGSRL